MPALGKRPLEGGLMWASESLLCLGSPEPSPPAPPAAPPGTSARCAVTPHVGGSDLPPLPSGAPFPIVHRPHYIFPNINEFPFFSLNTTAIYKWRKFFQRSWPPGRLCDLWLSAVIPMLRPRGSSVPFKAQWLSNPWRKLGSFFFSFLFPFPFRQDHSIVRDAVLSGYHSLFLHMNWFFFFLTP